MEKYCDACGKDVTTKVITTRATYSVDGDPIEVEELVLVCSLCGEELYSGDLDSATLISEYNKHRRIHKLL